MEWEDLRINAERLRRSLEEMARIGATSGGGVERLALTAEDQTARNLLVRWMGEAALEVTVDEMGNVFGRRAGTSGGLAPVLTGSHLDTQPRGGRLDGALGVMAALEVLRTLGENRIRASRPIVMVNWTNEEGTRFAPGIMGSGVWAGQMPRDRAYAQTDSRGRRFVDELERIGYRGAAPARPEPVHAYYELHIEQGPVLERLGRRIGVPHGIVGLHWREVRVRGQGNHAGASPMAGRSDALCAAAEMILAVEGTARAAGSGLVATVGRIRSQPGSPNIIPEEVVFTVDLRCWDDGVAWEAWRTMERAFDDCARRRGCIVHTAGHWDVRPVPFHPPLVRQIEETAQTLGHGTHAMVSGAGHDAGHVALVAPAAMVLVPSIGGRSHVEAEDTAWEDCAAGADVLLRCVLRSAMET